MVETQRMQKRSLSSGRLAPHEPTIALAFIFGLVFMVPQPTERLTDAFTATTLVATSLAVTAHVMRDLGVLGTREAQIILGVPASMMSECSTPSSRLTVCRASRQRSVATTRA